MDISEFLGALIFALVVFFSLDIFWLTQFAKKFYIQNIGTILRKNLNGKLAPRWIEALAFYVIYVIGTVFFGVRMAIISNGTWIEALVYGMLFGFFSYATYDLTNRATLETFPLKVVMVDLLWGAFISGFVSLFTFWFTTAFLL